MTIRKKIHLSNILMVVLPIAATALFIAICLETSLGDYWYAMETMYKDEHGIQSAQSLIYTYQQELWESNWGQGKEAPPSGEIQRNEKMNHLEEKLSDMGYHFMIVKNGNKIFANVTEEDMIVAEGIAGQVLWSATMLIVSEKNISVLKRTFFHGEKYCSIVAIHAGEENQEVVSYLQDYIFRYVWWFLGFFVVATVAINGVLSWWITKSVLLPLRRLKLGVRQIREGNLDGAMDYGKKDEFGEVCQDFDEMRAYLKESVEQRLEDEERKRALIIGISHDLRTPLASIRGYLDGLMEGIANTPEKQERYFRAIWIRTQDLSRLVESLSEYNRLDSRSFHYELQPDDLKQFLEEYLEAYHDEATQNHIEYVLECDSNGAYGVLTNRNELKRVFDNLFINTIRYREKESSRVRISVREIKNQGMVECVFTDDGPGVPEESLGRIFDSFYRVDGARSNAGEGSGIGLAIVKEILNGHRGSVQAANHNGLSIVIRLPMMEPA